MKKRYNIHSQYIKNYDGDCVIVKEHEEQDDGSFEPKLKFFKNPKRPFYITKPEHRRNKFKIEMEDINKLDRFVCHQYELDMVIAKALNMYGRVSRSKLYSSPYLYGADIDTEALIKMKYFNEFHHGSTPALTYGFFDIEQDTDNKDIILITFCTWNGKIYTAMLDSYLYLTDGTNRTKYEEGLVHEMAEKQLAQYYKSHNLKLTTFVGKTPVELIYWIFQRIHEEKVDFIGVWKLDYDIPEILETIRNSKYAVETILTPKEIPKQYRKVWYMEDKSKVDHFTLKWHWFHCSGYSQFIDSMCLFSLCRKTQGYRRSYTLDNILDEELNLGKLSLGKAQSHYYMRNFRFLDYTIYNIFDAFSMVLLEQKNEDIATMYALSGVTPVKFFPRQTKKSTNTFYNNFLKKGKVISTTSKLSRFNNIKKLFKNTGGAVLPPERTKGVGIQILR